MKSDISRDSFKAEKHFSAVRSQMGRVQLDADWNEQADIQNHRRRTMGRDVVAPSGAPRDNAGFAITTSADASDLVIGPGRMYVEGVLVENESAYNYSAQSQYPGAPAISDAGLYLAYLEVKERSVTSLEDDSIRERALGGPDSTTRVQIVRQVKLLSVADITPLNRVTVPPEWPAHIARNTGRMRARTTNDGQTASPCDLGTLGGYSGSENRLYRVEIHRGGAPGTATFKWSRDNGSFATRLLRQDGDLLTVESAGLDATRSFVPGGWVEVTDETLELQGKPGTLLQVTHVQGKGLTFKTDNIIHFNRDSRDPALTDFDINEFDASTRKVRRWEMSDLIGEVTIPTTPGTFIELENGISVEFDSDASAEFRTGDAWMIPARTATRNIEWPCDPATDLPAMQDPYGAQPRYVRLAYRQRLEHGLSRSDRLPRNLRRPALSASTCAGEYVPHVLPARPGTERNR